MNISKTLREYIEETIKEKVRNKTSKLWEQRNKEFDKIRPKLDKLYEDYLYQSRKLIEEAGLNPNDYGYSEGSYATRLPQYAMPYIGPRHGDVYKNTQDILLRIELDEIPKKEIKNFVDNYDVTISYED